MNSAEMRALVDQYIDAYNRMDVAGILLTVHPDVKFGLEILSFGGSGADSNSYTPAMYSTLRRSIDDLSQNDTIPLSRGWVIGHEGVHPVAQFGWDPAAGFDWSQVHR